MSLETQLEQVAADVNTIKENVATVYNAGYKAGANVVEEHVSNADVHTSLEEKQNLNARITSVEDAAENWMTMIDEAREIAVSADSVAGTAVQKAEAVHNNLKEHINNSDVHTSAEEKNTWNNKADGNHSHDEYATQQNVSDVYQFAEDVASDLQGQINEKANKPTVFSYEYLSHEYEFNYMYNHDIRNGELTTLSFTFGNGEYQPDYISGLSFDSGATPTAIDYTDSGILNWVGTDCVTSDGLSIFQPSANTHYDIVFYFNGKQFIGLVNGFVPATGNEAV